MNKEQCVLKARTGMAMNVTNKKSLWQKLRNLTMRIIIAKVADCAGYWRARLFRSGWIFKSGDREFHYFFHPYNVTWRHERAVEIPIIMDMMKGAQGKRILEVGNVLSNYFSLDHDVVDKYDQSERVIRQDVVDIKAPGKYDLIVSISTLEHVGWDETPKDSNKVLKAIGVLKQCLSKEGLGVVTFPVGYNPPMDALFEKGALGFKNFYCFKRVSSDNRWEQAQWQDIKNLAYNFPYNDANGIVIGFFGHSAK